MRKLLSRKGIMLAAFCAPTVGVVALFIFARGANAESSVTPGNATAQHAAWTEPTTAEHTIPSGGSESPMRAPFAAYDSGPAEGRWDYTSLHSSEQQDIDRERAANARAKWNTTHDSYGSALAGQAKAAASVSAARQLGIDNLATLGVVP